MENCYHRKHTSGDLIDVTRERIQKESRHGADEKTDRTCVISPISIRTYTGTLSVHSPVVGFIVAGNCDSHANVVLEAASPLARTYHGSPHTMSHTSSTLK